MDKGKDFLQFFFIVFFFLEIIMNESYFYILVWEFEFIPSKKFLFFS